MCIKPNPFSVDPIKVFYPSFVCIMIRKRRRSSILFHVVSEDQAVCMGDGATVMSSSSSNSSSSNNRSSFFFAFQFCRKLFWPLPLQLKFFGSFAIFYQALQKLCQKFFFPFSRFDIGMHFCSSVMRSTHFYSHISASQKSAIPSQRP